MTNITVRGYQVSKQSSSNPQPIPGSLIVSGYRPTLRLLDTYQQKITLDIRDLSGNPVNGIRACVRLNKSAFNPDGIMITAEQKTYFSDEIGRIEMSLWQNTRSMDCTHYIISVFDRNTGQTILDEETFVVGEEDAKLADLLDI